MSIHVFARDPKVLQALLRHIREGVILLDEQERILTFNAKARKWLGLQPEHDLGRPWEEVIQRHPQLYLAYRQLKLDSADRLDATIAGGSPQTFEMERIEIPGPPKRVLVLLHDVTLLKEAALRIRQADTHIKRQMEELENLWKRVSEELYRDPLTGVYNRRYLEEKLWEEINRARRSGIPLGVLMVDVDDLKYWNDTHGHIMGDTLLILVARVLKEMFHPHAVARYGGDEFVVLLPGMEPKAVEARLQAVNRRLQEAWPQQARRRGGTISAGLALYPWNGQTPTELLEAADAALYESKRRGKARLMLSRRRAGGQTRVLSKTKHPAKSYR